jgi:predicted transglutaminase-like cysteine proteinase
MRRALRWLVLRPSLRIASPLAVALLGVLYSDGSAAQKLAALPKSSPGLISWETTKPIPAWNDFCQSYPRECLVDLAEPATVTLTKATWNAILEVNRRVNAAIAPLSDHDHWGALDRWDLPSDGYGDCEDFQLLKRRLLADQGLPRRAMRMTVVINRQGEGHAVLMVRTDPGDLILDNQRSAVLPWDQTGYHLREARRPPSGSPWAGLSHPPTRRTNSIAGGRGSLDRAASGLAPPRTRPGNAADNTGAMVPFIRPRSRGSRAII